MSLSDLREKLEASNRKILELFGERAKLAGAIQELKGREGLAAYDPRRELELFKFLAEELSRLNLKELVAFSLLMEAHAGADYPAWSEGAHLDNARPDLFINPLLLLLFHPDKFKVVRLNDKFRYLLRVVEES